MLDRYAFILLSVEKFWNGLCDRNRAGKTLHVFIRRGLVGPKNAKLLLFYVTHPHKEIRGVGEFIERITGYFEDLWKTHGREFLLRSYEEYGDFLKGRRKATFIRFKKPTRTSHAQIIKRHISRYWEQKNALNGHVHN